MAIKNSKVSRWRIRNDELQAYKRQDCIHRPLTEDLGEGYSNVCQLDEDLSYIETEYKPSRNLAMLNKINNQEPKLIVTLGLKGHSRFANMQGEDIVFSEGYTSITTATSSVGERQFEANKHVLQLRFSMSKHWLQRYFDEAKTNRLFKSEGVQMISHKPISTQGIVVAQQLTACSVSDEIKKLFIHGQAMSILASELAPLFSKQRKSTTTFSKNDKEIVNTARDILYKEFKKPPSVEQLSKQVGCNQFKLKQLFHHFFNNTPYGVLLEIRMNKAYELLESTQCHVNIAANFVGYNHASNFSTAFIKFFGVAPKTISKQG